MTIFQSLSSYTWRTVLVALSYMAGLMIVSVVGAASGSAAPVSASAGANLLWLLVSSVLLGVITGAAASRITLNRLQHFVLWSSLIFFNLGSVAIEGKFFAPDLVPVPLSVLFIEHLVASAGAALAVMFLFATIGPSVSWMSALRTRPWYSWLWRLVASGLSYVTFYFIFGGLNYSLITKPYYDTHAGGLNVPAPETVFIIEPIRGVLIALSVLFFLLSFRGTKRQTMAITGWLLFAIGGIVPLVLQISMLPPFLLVASAVEIFLQNFLTGVVAAWLMRVEESDKTKMPAALHQPMPL